MKNKKVHRGEVLKNAVKNSGIAIKIATDRAGYSRASYYHHILQENLSLHILLKYGKALDIDFSESIPEINTIDQMEFGNPTTLKEAKKQITLLKEKYYSLLEKYNNFLENKD